MMGFETEPRILSGAGHGRTARVIQSGRCCTRACYIWRNSFLRLSGAAHFIVVGRLGRTLIDSFERSIDRR